MLIDDFATALHRSTFGNAPWPTAWVGDMRTARARTLLAAFNFGPRLGFSLTDFIPVNGMLGKFAHGGCSERRPLTQAPWQAFRAIEDQAHRRAALWIGAWDTVPDIPRELRPTYLPLAPYRDWREAWRRFSRGPARTRMAFERLVAECD